MWRFAAVRGYRPKQVLTLLGKVTLKRVYSQCRVEADSPAGEQEAGAEEDVSQQEVWTHGEASADLHWGLHGRRTSAGVQQAVSYLCAYSTLEEAAETDCSPYRCQHARPST